MADRVPEASEALASVTLNKNQIDAWRHAIVTAGYLFDKEANRLRESIGELPVVDATDAIRSATFLVGILKQQAREAWAAADLLEEADSVEIFRTPAEGGVA